MILPTSFPPKHARAKAGQEAIGPCLLDLLQRSSGGRYLASETALARRDLVTSKDAPGRQVAGSRRAAEGDFGVLAGLAVAMAGNATRLRVCRRYFV
jgi:hypothetical protein